MPPKGRPKKKGGKRKKKKQKDLETKKEKLLKWYTIIIDQLSDKHADKLNNEHTVQNSLEKTEVDELRHRDIVFHRISRAVDDMKLKEQQTVDAYEVKNQEIHADMMKAEQQQAERLLQIIAKIKHLVVCIAKSEAILAELIYFRDVGAKLLATRIGRLNHELTHLQSAYETLSRDMLRDRDEFFICIAREVEAALAVVPRQVFVQLMHALPRDKHQLLLTNWWMKKELQKNKVFFAELTDIIESAENVNVQLCSVIQHLQRDYYKSLAMSGMCTPANEQKDSVDLVPANMQNTTLSLLPVVNERRVKGQTLGAPPPFTDTFPDRQSIYDSVTINRRRLNVRGRQLPVKVLSIARQDFHNELSMELRQNVGVMDDFLTDIYDNFDGFAPDAEDCPPIAYSRVWGNKNKQLPYISYLAREADKAGLLGKPTTNTALDVKTLPFDIMPKCGRRRRKCNQNAKGDKGACGKRTSSKKRTASSDVFGDNNNIGSDAADDVIQDFFKRPSSASDLPPLSWSPTSLSDVQ